MNVVKLLAIVLMVMAMLMLVVVVVTAKMAPMLAAGHNRKRHTRKHMMTLRGNLKGGGQKWAHFVFCVIAGRARKWTQTWVTQISVFFSQ